MDLFKTLDSSIISFVILLIIYINLISRSQKVFMGYKLLISLVLINMFMLVIDFFTWVFNGLPGVTNHIIHMGVNFLLYTFAPLPILIWILYINFQVSHDPRKVAILKKYLAIPFVLNAVITGISLFTGWYFKIDANNVYERGSFFFIYIIFIGILFGISFVYIIRNRQVIEKRNFYALLIFVVPAIVGIVAQILFYGTSYNWSGMMLSILIIYLNIQDNSLNTDYLTGAFNRRLLDRYVKLKILTSTEKKTFSAILVDLKKFKSINDKFGHMIGDEALQESVKLIRSCLRIDDIIARYGGDEFYIILDISDKKLLEETVQRINSSIDRFNNESQKSYKIGFDMGYDVYDYNSKMKSEEFFKHLDRRMYGNKSPE